jgi:hypothetical protein
MDGGDALEMDDTETAEFGMDGDEVSDEEEVEMDMGDEGEDEMMDSVEYDLDEEAEEDDEVVEEATKLSNNVAAPKAPNADASNGVSPVAKHKAGWETGAPVKAKDGSEGNKGANKAKDHTPTSNIKVEPKKV